MLGHLDKLENHPVYYTRTSQEFVMLDSAIEDFKSGDCLEAGIYLLKNFRQDLLHLPTMISYSGISESQSIFKNFVKLSIALPF